MVPTSVNGKLDPTYICFRRGNAAPLVDLAVMHATDDTVPHCFQKVEKNANYRNEAKRSANLCVRRLAVTLVSTSQHSCFDALLNMFLARSHS